MTEYPSWPLRAWEVSAILSGRKNQARLIVKLPPTPNHLGRWEPTTIGGPGLRTKRGEVLPEQGAIWHTRTGQTICGPHSQPGDRLWGREAWAEVPKPAPGPKCHMVGARGVTYRADWSGNPSGFTWRSSTSMPRWASRFCLEVTSVRVERLQEINEADARAEGVVRMPHYWAVPDLIRCDDSAVGAYAGMWEQVHGKGSWLANPWVWVREFQLVVTP